MATITKVKSSRKEWRCGRCGKEIHKGDPYIRGELNFSKPVIRCTDCGLESWEVTTSDYQLTVGETVYRWQSHYDPSEEAVEAIISDLEDVKSDLEDRLDNMPDGLREGDTGCLLQDRIDSLDSAISDLENIDCEQDEDESDDDYVERITEEIDSALGNIEM